MAYLSTIILIRRTISLSVPLSNRSAGPQWSDQEPAGVGSRPVSYPRDGSGSCLARQPTRQPVLEGFGTATGGRLAATWPSKRPADAHNETDGAERICS